MEIFNKFYNINEEENENKEEEEKIKECCKNIDNHIITDIQSICKICGKMLNNNFISDSPEWFNYSHEETRCENSFNHLLPRLSMNTFLSGNKYTKLQKIHLWSKITSEERSLLEVFNKIDRYMIYKFNKDIIESVKYFYKKIYLGNETKTKVLTRGNNRLGLISGCIYIMSNNNNILYEPYEIAKMCEIDTKIVKNGIKKIYSLEHIQDMIDDINFNNYFIRYTNLLKIEKDFTNLFIEVYNRINKLRLLENNTNIVIVFGIIYLTLSYFNIDISKKYLCNLSNISEITLNKFYSNYKIYNDILFTGITIN